MTLNKYIYTGFTYFINRVMNHKDTQQEDIYTIEKDPIPARPGKVFKYRNKRGLYIYKIIYDELKYGRITIIVTTNQDEIIKKSLEDMLFLYTQLHGSYIIFTEKEYDRNSIRFKGVNSDNEAIEGEILDARNSNEKYELILNQIQEYSISKNDIVGKKIKNQMKPYVAIKGSIDYLKALIDGEVNIDTTMLGRITDFSNNYESSVLNLARTKKTTGNHNRD